MNHKKRHRTNVFERYVLLYIKASMRRCVVLCCPRLSFATYSFFLERINLHAIVFRRGRCRRRTTVFKSPIPGEHRTETAVHGRGNRGDYRHQRILGEMRTRQDDAQRRILHADFDTRGSRVSARKAKDFRSDVPEQKSKRVQTNNCQQDVLSGA